MLLRDLIGSGDFIEQCGAERQESDDYRTHTDKDGEPAEDAQRAGDGTALSQKSRNAGTSDDYASWQPFGVLQVKILYIAWRSPSKLIQMAEPAG